MAVFFNGRLLTTPTVASQIYDQGMLDQQPATGNTLAIIGTSTGGVPTTAEWIYSVAEARAYLKGGDLLRAVELAFAPSTETCGPQAIVAVRVNVATQSSRYLKDGSDANNILVQSTDFGVGNNNIRIKVETGTTTGKKVSIQQGSTVYTGDNLARNCFYVYYNGSADTGYVTVTDTTVVLETKTGTADKVAIATITLTQYPTIQDVVDRINAETGFYATASDGVGTYSSQATMDNKASTDCTDKSSPYTGGQTITGSAQVIVDWLNSTGELLVTGTRVAAVTGGPANVAWSYLTGGTDGPAVTLSDYNNCLQVLETEDVQWIVPLTSDETVWASLSTHLDYMSNTGKRERRGFVGPATGKTVQQACDYAVAINSDRVSLCYPGIYHYSDAPIYADRVLTLYPCYFTAALLGGAFSGINPGETMTNKTLNVMGLETPIVAPGDTDSLISGGVLAVYRDPKGVSRVARAISTWLGDTRYNRVEVSTGCAVDYTCREVRDKLQMFVGKKASPTTLQSVNAMVDSVLRGLATPEPIGLGLLVGDEAHPAYKNISSSIVGDVLRVTFECSPAIPINYILVSIHVTPYTSVAQ